MTCQLWTSGKTSFTSHCQSHRSDNLSTSTSRSLWLPDHLSFLMFCHSCQFNMLSHPDNVLTLTPRFFQLSIKPSPGNNPTTQSSPRTQYLWGTICYDSYLPSSPTSVQNWDDEGLARAQQATSSPPRERELLYSSVWTLTILTLTTKHFLQLDLGVNTPFSFPFFVKEEFLFIPSILLLLIRFLNSF